MYCLYNYHIYVHSYIYLSTSQCTYLYTLSVYIYSIYTFIYTQHAEYYIYTVYI